MALKKEKGIVIESRDIGDSDRLISLAGENLVRMKFLSKGIRKSKRRAIAGTELGSLVEIDFYDQAEKEWKSTKEINLINRYDALKSDYLGTLFLMYLCELSMHLFPEGEEHPFIYQLLSGCFEYCSEHGFKYEILPFFKLRALVNLGHFPRDFYCVSCGEDILSKSKAFFSWENREFHCGDCHSIPKDHMSILRLFDMILRLKFGNLILQKPNQDQIREADFVLNQYLRSITGKEMKSYFEFYKTLGN
ncbi:DNA repair protein RecO [Leptospira ilyithenensis]|uniref:DNA repair protein RecO n=1 Tax=Leptospira ilyithenensis TaxID=2484901 RepID=A0A4R9LMT7_9LEPT|nr:DNA repair protein RecO [Leptospira ilyithenensis]TGN10009.1 DNA repair protein RecO [Leptospira ilyithenensis]